MIKNFIDKLLGKKPAAASRSLFGKRRDVMADEHKIDPALVDDRAATVVRTLKQATDEAQRDAIVRAIEHSGGNKRQAARTLGVSYKTLFNKLKELGIQTGLRIDLS